MISFEDYLCNRNDAIDNAAYQLICAMTAQDHNEHSEAGPVWRGRAREHVELSPKAEAEQDQFR